MEYNRKKNRITIALSLVISSLLSSTALVVLRYGIGPVWRDSGAGRGAAFLAAAMVFILLNLFFTRKIRRRRRILARPFPPEWERILYEEVHYYRALKPEERERFNDTVKIFLGEKIITGIETDVDDRCRVLVAASAVIPVFNIPGWEYDRLGEVLIYPTNFDEQYNFTDTGRDILGMVVSQSSAMIISKPALYQGFARARDKSNVGIHEFIHKIDEEDGVIDGVPALLMDRDTAAKWLDLMKSESRMIERGASEINTYALTDQAEFFSVVSEYFFERPDEMMKRHPALYAIMKVIFRQDTAGLLKSVLKSMVTGGRKKIGRNSPCPCGSGKKYKKCCLGR